jgi:hypothetical protein
MRTCQPLCCNLVRAGLGGATHPGLPVADVEVDNVFRQVGDVAPKELFVLAFQEAFVGPVGAPCELLLLELLGCSLGHGCDVSVGQGEGEMAEAVFMPSQLEYLLAQQAQQSAGTT